VLRGLGQSHRTLVHAVEVAIGSGDLPAAARAYGKIDLLEALAGPLGLAPSALRNLYYRDEARLELVLQAYISDHDAEVATTLRDLPFRQYSPIVWRRPTDQMRESRRSLPKTLVMLQAADKSLRDSPDSPVALRREIGSVAAEVMACALTFYDGKQRWDLLREGERIFKTAMAPLSLEIDVEAGDAALFAKFWENRATVCGLEWSNIWDDPAQPPGIGSEVIELAQRELDRAARWAEQFQTGQADGDERRRQLLADKAKWLAKAGRFDEGWRLIDTLPGDSYAAQSDRLLLKTLEHIAQDRLADAAGTAGEMREVALERDVAGALAPVTSSILIHNIDLLRGRRQVLGKEIESFLEASPVVASEMINLPHYKLRLRQLGYATPAPSFS
jgi:hypothetical protein